MPQTQTGSTVNVNIGVNAATGALTYTFNDPFDMLINLQNSSSIVTIGGSRNDKINLLNSSASTINGGAGNNIYAVGATAASLNDNIIRGGTGIDFITMVGSNTFIDLTAGSSGVEAVVGNYQSTGESVTVALNTLVGSALKNGNNRAFVSLIGSDGIVNLTQTGLFKYQGVVDAAGNGYDANGAAITGTALTALKAKVTSISSITGNLAALYANSPTNSVPANETQVSQKLSAYVFSDATKSYTVWSDGQLDVVDAKGNTLPAFYQPAPVAPATPFTYNSVAMFNKAGTYAQGSTFQDAEGITHVRLDNGSTRAATAINLVSSVSGIAVNGDNGQFGANYFGLGGSGGSNKIIGSPGGNVFDLINSLSLKDQLLGGNGFDVVRAPANGANVDLTVNGDAGKNATLIDAVVGSNNLASIQTAVVDVNTLRYTPDATGAKTAAFAALLGSFDDTLSLTGGGKWIEVATFNPGDPLPDHARALSSANLAQLDASFGASPHKAATSLIGHLFEQVDLKGNAIKYVTIYADSTIDNQLVAPGSATLAAAHIGDFIL